MTTNNPLNPNPEDAEKQIQEENSDQTNAQEVQEDAQEISDAKLAAENKESKKEKKPSKASATKKEKPATTEPKQTGAAIARAESTPAEKAMPAEAEEAPPPKEKVKKPAKKKVTKAPKIKVKAPEKVEVPEEKEAEPSSLNTTDVEPEQVADEAVVVPVTEPKKTESPVETEAKNKAEGDIKKVEPEPAIIEEIHAEEEDHDDEEHEEAESTSEETPLNYDELGIEELVSLLEKIVQEEELSLLRKKVALIKVAFQKKHKLHLEEKLETVAASEDETVDKDEKKDELGDRFKEAFKQYSEKRKAYLDQLEIEKQKNLESKKLILEDLKALIESEESLKKTYDDFKDLQDKWKAVGMVPKGEVNNLWQNYHFYVEKFFDKVKINKELRDLDLKKNMELKIDLCEKAEELLLETSVLKSFKQLQQLHRQWKEVGPIPQDKKDELWDRFKNATEKINVARRDHYNETREEQENNLTAKSALCEKAEEILQRENTSVKNWQENTSEISELLKVWKTTGQAPRKENDEIWDRFKTSLDTFFAGKKEYFQEIKDEQLNNYNLKLDLCSQAEAIKNSTDWKETTRELINLQKEWKTIGPVPRKHSDKIWHRFRAACDEFFNSKSEFFTSRKSNETDNLKIKEKLINKVKTFEYGKDKSENLEILNGFQREWTEIGHVPFKDKDRLQNEFRKVINDQLDQLKISKTEMQSVNYKQRFENIKENPNASRIVRNEKYFLQQKVKKLEDEIQLLENNMGFLAKSKKADLLKEEFMKKIDSAREEVVSLKDKIKFLERETE